MKKNLKAILLLVGFVLFPNIVHADNITPIYGNKLTWNIESIYYYLDGNSTQYSSIIASAANNWVYTGYGYNKLYPNTRIYDITGTAVDFKTYSQSDNVIAETFFFTRANGTGPAETVNPRYSNWLFSEIKINTTKFDTLSEYNKIGSIAHEFGHAWGLAHHNNNRESIMCQLGYYRMVNTVQQVDQDAFNSIYY